MSDKWSNEGSWEDRLVFSDDEIIANSATSDDSTLDSSSSTDEGEGEPGFFELAVTEVRHDSTRRVHVYAIQEGEAALPFKIATGHHLDPKLGCANRDFCANKIVDSLLNKPLDDPEYAWVALDRVCKKCIKDLAGAYNPKKLNIKSFGMRAEDNLDWRFHKQSGLIVKKRLYKNVLKCK